MKKQVTIASCYAASTVKTPEEWSKPGTGFSAKSFKLNKDGLAEAKLALHEELDRFLDSTWNQFYDDNSEFN